MGNEITYKPFGEQAILIEWKSIIDTNLISMFTCSKRAFLHFKRRFRSTNRFKCGKDRG